MQNRLARLAALLFVVLLTLSLCVVEAGAQKRKKRRSHRTPKPVVTNPTITPPSDASATAAGEDKIISTADENTGGSDRNTDSTQQKEKTKPDAKASDEESMRQTINSLSNQVNRLTNKLSEMQDNDRMLLDMERLTRAEQRAESLRQQLIETQTKDADLQARLDQIEYEIKPENIERSMATFGTVHPEEARAARRRQLENEKSRLQAQVQILEGSITRLQTAVVTADNEVDLLRNRIESQRRADTSAGSADQQTAPQKKPE